MWSTPEGLGVREEGSGLTLEELKHSGEGEVLKLAEEKELLRRHDNNGQGVVPEARGRQALGLFHAAEDALLDGGLCTSFFTASWWQDGGGR